MTEDMHERGQARKSPTLQFSDEVFLVVSAFSLQLNKRMTILKKITVFWTFLVKSKKRRKKKTPFWGGSFSHNRSTMGSCVSKSRSAVPGTNGEGRLTHNGKVMLDKAPTVAALTHPAEIGEEVSPFRMTRKCSIERDREGHKMVNQYVLLGNIGSGSYSTVKQIWDAEQEHFFAMKIVKKKSMRQKFGHSKQGQTKNFDPDHQIKTEIAVMKQLHHENIVVLHEVIDDEDRDRLYLVMDLVPHGPVLHSDEDTFESEPVPEETARHYFSQITQAIRYLHFHKIAHRDIKPDNLLIHNGHILLVDFGCALIFDEDDLAHSPAGSPFFFAPEMCSGDSRDYSTKKADVWAMGVCLYMFIYGRPPYVFNNALQLYQAIANNEPVPFPADSEVEVSSDLKDFFLLILEKDPAKRISIDEIAVHPWITKNGSSPLPDLIHSEVEVQEADLHGALRPWQQQPQNLVEKASDHLTRHPKLNKYRESAVGKSLKLVSHETPFSVPGTAVSSPVQTSRRLTLNTKVQHASKS
mmetsp:Transcript_44695/g.87557  ORF Transcript_44695/g.87557 Transcript_44695/m.87557 type:complete len:524 (+) Transcript_44695:595-2166(+)